MHGSIMGQESPRTGSACRAGGKASFRRCTGICLHVMRADARPGDIRRRHLTPGQETARSLSRGGCPITCILMHFVEFSDRITTLMQKGPEKMTYCVAMSLKQGLVFVSDTRTNAGMDHISVFRKLYRFSVGHERTIVLQAAGNLATTQSVIAELKEGIAKGAKKNLYNGATMFEAAELVGETIRNVISRDTCELTKNVALGCSILVGGYIEGDDARLLDVYSEGNFISATIDTPYFQIGETKYGKPILDRIITFDTSLEDALKCTLVSFDSTIKSNLSVGYPLDLLVIDKVNKIEYYKRIKGTDPYPVMIRNTWGDGLKKVFHELDEFIFDDTPLTDADDGILM